MAERNIFDTLKRLFSSDVIIRNVGGDQLKVVDVNNLQSSGKYQTNSLVDRFTRLYIYNNKNVFNPNLNYQTLRVQLYSDYEAMDTDPIIASALDILADESVIKSEFGEVLSIRSSDENIQRVLYNLFYDILNIEFNLWSWVRSTCKYGDFFLKLEIAEELGVYNVIPYTVYHVSRHEGMDPDNPTKVTFRLNPDGIAASQDANYKPNNSRSAIEFDNYEMVHFRLLADSAFLPYGRCLPADSYVEMESGVKQINEIEAGDRVWTYNKDRDTYELENVLATCASGKKGIIKVNTRHNTVRSSAEHPFLIYNTGEDTFEYRKAVDLRLGDLLVTSNRKLTAPRENPRIEKTLEGFNKNGWKNNISAIPDNITPEFARFFGFMLGDGYIVRGTTVCFAQGVRKERNNYYQNLLRRFSGKENLRFCNGIINNTEEYAICSVGSKMLSTVLKNNGFEGKCYTKRAPKWIFQCDRETQLEFVRGFVDADGSISVDKFGVRRYQIMLSNEDLIKDIKEILNRIGIKTGQILKTKKKEFCYFGDKKYNANQGYYMYFYMEGQEKQQLKKYSRHLQNDEIILTPIISLVDEEIEEETYDIQVSGTNSNFICNGVVVHNSFIEPVRKIYKQLCLAGDTKIWTGESFKAIKDITEGTSIYSYDYEKGLLVPSTVKKQILTGTKPVYEIKTGHRTIQATAEHPILVEGGIYKKVEDLTVNDYLVYVDREEQEPNLEEYQRRTQTGALIEKVRSIELKENPVDVYDIEVDNDLHNFVAEGLVVHNCLLEDSVMIHRIMRSPEKRMFYINVGSIPPHEVEQFMQKTMNTMKKTPYLGSDGQYNLKFNMQNMMEDFYIPVRGNDQTTRIETTKGLEYDGVTDIRYYQEKLFAGLKIPKAFMGYEGELCVVPETRIPLLDGNIKTVAEIIEDYQNGIQNYTYSLNEDTKDIVPGKILWAGYTRKNAELVKVHLDNGEYLDTTPDHLFLTRDGVWIEAQNLAEGVSLFPSTQEEDIEIHVVKVERLEERRDTCDIHIENHHSFGTEAGVIIHNSGKALLSQESVRFARTVERIQKMIEAELTKIALVHLATQGFNGESLTNFEIHLTTPSIAFEQEKVALLKEKVDLANQMKDSNLFSSDYIYEKIFDLSEDTYNEMRDLILEDKKLDFRFAQMENEGNDPAKTGKSYGTPHDLASMYGRRSESSDRGADLGQVPAGYEDDPNPPVFPGQKKDTKIGRPRTNKSLWGTNNYPVGGRDPLGKHKGYPSDNENMMENLRTKTILSRNLKDIRSIQLQKEKASEPDLLSEHNIKDIEETL